MAESTHDRALRNLRTMRDRYVYLEPNRFKAKAYADILDRVEALPKGLRTLEDVKSVAKGKSTAATLEHIVTTNTDVPEVAAVKDDLKTYNDLSEVHGIGPAKARELVNTHGVTTVDALRKRADELLNDVQKRGLKYHDHTRLRIPRKEMRAHHQFVSSTLAGLEDGAFARAETHRFSFLGSYRRQLESSGDIDVLLTAPTNCLRQVMNALQSAGYVDLSQAFAFGRHKFMGVCKLPDHDTWRRLDVLYSPPSEFPFALLYFTGSKEFNTQMRAFALTKGYSLNEKGLTSTTPGSGPVSHSIENEHQIFEFLGLRYVTPQNRNDNTARYFQTRM